MKRHVVDASVAVKWYIPEPLAGQAATYLEKFRQGQAVLIAPELITAEIGNVLWKKQRSGELTREEVRVIINLISHSFPAKLSGTSELLPAAMEIAITFGLTVYDSLYMAQAAIKEAVLVTADRKLARYAENFLKSGQVELLG